MDDFIYKYFLDPITSKTGYNFVNTLVYAAIAIICVYVLYKIFERYKIKIDNNFFYGALSFVLFGSTMRVVTDSIDTGVFTPINPVHRFILDSHIFDYGYLTTTPGIYIVVALLFLISFFITNKLGKPQYLKYIGLFLFAFNFLLLLPFIQYLIFLIPILILVLIPVLICLKYFKNKKYAFVVAGHSLDGAATFFMIDLFGQITGISYWEQHVLSRAVGDLFGTYFTFYLLKVFISFLAVYFISKENLRENEENYLILLIAIIGFAPGIRDVLRMLIGG